MPDLWNQYPGFPFQSFPGTGPFQSGPSGWPYSGMMNPGWNWGMQDVSSLNKMLWEIPKQIGNLNQANSTAFTQPAGPYQFFQKPPQPFPAQLGGTSPPDFNQMMKGAVPLLASFQNESGEIDFDKLFSTVGQMVSTVNQLTPLLKGFSSIMKGM